MVRRDKDSGEPHPSPGSHTNRCSLHVLYKETTGMCDEATPQVQLAELDLNE